MWSESMQLVEEYAEKYGDVSLLLGPVFDYNMDGLADTAEEINT